MDDKFQMSLARSFLAGIVLGSCVLLGSPAFAGTRIAVLDFELNDLTLLPGTPEELARTANVAPLLREALVKKGGYESVAIDPAAQAQANVSFGYLFDHTEVAAQLGERFGVDWIAVGRVHKPSFLFAYLKVRLVNARTRRLVGDFVVEVKGHLKKLTERGAAILADQIDQTIRQKTP
ncbi:MAG: DUF2380 domain-containing protein [Gammaproteobacteria bacterium]